MNEEEEMKESLEEPEAEIKSTLPEAPQSIHVDAYFKGFHAGFTIRKESNEIVAVDQTIKLINGLVEKGFKPSWNEKTNGDSLKPATQTMICAACGVSAEYREGVSKLGKPYKAVFCSTGDKTHTKWL